MLLRITHTIRNLIMIDMVLSGRRWFSIDSKPFKLKVVGEGRKVQVVITERRREGSSWIRFGEEGAKILLKGVESFRKEAWKNSEGLEWRENGRRYSLELRKNDGGHFILCSVADLDGKRHQLFFRKRSDKWVDFVRRSPASYGN